MIMVRKNNHKKSKSALMHAKASLEIEGIHFTTQEEQLLLERANGRLSYSEFITRAREIAKNV